MKTVLITGAGRGIGLSCTKIFLENKWEVFAQYRQSDKELWKLQDQYKNLYPMKFDFFLEEDRADFIKFIRSFRIIDDPCHIDMLINNAGVHDLSGMQLDKINEVFLINAIFPSMLALEVFEIMKKNNLGGQIVNVSSIAAKYGSNTQNIFYGASKRALEACTRTLARDGLSYNIMVNTVRPGVTDTKFHDGLKRNMEKRIKEIPFGRAAQPEEISAMIYNFFGKGGCLTNQTITISGGE